MRTRRAFTFGVPVIVLLSFAAVACSDNAEVTVSTETGRVQVINASAVAVDVRVDGAVKQAAVPVGEIGQSLVLPIGQHVVQFAPAGSGLGAVSVTVDVGTNIQRTVAATRVGSGLGAMALVDTGSVVGDGRSKLRVLHLAANAPPLDIWRTQPDYQTPISILFPYSYLSGGTVESSAGVWEVRVWPTGAGSWSSAASALSIPMTSGQLRTVVTVDVAGGGVKLQLLPL